jgi:hypothetical protein
VGFLFVLGQKQGIPFEGEGVGSDLIGEVGIHLFNLLGDLLNKLTRKFQNPSVC